MEGLVGVDDWMTGRMSRQVHGNRVLPWASILGILFHEFSFSV